MNAVAGLYTVAALLLAGAGAAKAIDPAGTAGALGALGLPRARSVVRVGGVGELVIGAGALLAHGPVFPGLMALSYLAFAVFVGAALRSRSPISSCGCFAKIDTPPSVLHLVINLGAAGVAAAALIGGHDLTFRHIVEDQPLAGAPFIALVAVAGYVVFVSLTALPVTLARVRTTGTTNPTEAAR